MCMHTSNTSPRALLTSCQQVIDVHVAIGNDVPLSLHFAFDVHIKQPGTSVGCLSRSGGSSRSMLRRAANLLSAAF